MPTFANVVAISNLFDISIDDLVRGDMSLMNSLTANQKEPLSRVFKIVFGGLILGIIMYIAALILHIKGTTFAYWATVPILVLFIWLLFTINWRQFNRSLSSNTVILGIVLLALVLVPFIFENVSAALHGATTAYQAGYNSIK